MIFQPRGINALLARSPSETVRLVTNNRIHLAILDDGSESTTESPARRLKLGPKGSGIRTLRSIRNRDRLLPCILLAQQVDDRLLTDALALGAFSVLGKPVDLQLLAGKIDQLFRKCYESDVFSPLSGPGASN